MRPGRSGAQEPSRQARRPDVRSVVSSGARLRSGAATRGPPHSGRVFVQRSDRSQPPTARSKRPLKLGTFWSRRRAHSSLGSRWTSGRLVASAGARQHNHDPSEPRPAPCGATFVEMLRTHLSILTPRTTSDPRLALSLVVGAIRGAPKVDELLIGTFDSLEDAAIAHALPCRLSTSTPSF